MCIRDRGFRFWVLGLRFRLIYRDLDGVDVGDDIVNEQQLCGLRRATRLEARDACQAIKGADLEFEPELRKAYHVVWRVLHVPRITRNTVYLHRQINQIIM